MSEEQITRAQAQDQYAKSIGYKSWDDLYNDNLGYDHRKMYILYSVAAYNYWQSLIQQSK